MLLGIPHSNFTLFNYFLSLKKTFSLNKIDKLNSTYCWIKRKYVKPVNSFLFTIEGIFKTVSS